MSKKEKKQEDRKPWEGEELELLNADLNMIRTQAIPLLRKLNSPENPGKMPKKTKLQLYAWTTAIEDLAEYKAFCKLADEQVKSYFEDWKNEITEARKLDDKGFEDFYRGPGQKMFNSYLQTRLNDFATDLMLEQPCGAKIRRFVLDEASIPEEVTPEEMKHGRRFIEFRFEE